MIGNSTLATLSYDLQAKIYEEIHQFHDNASGKSTVITGQKPALASPPAGAAEQGK